VVCVIAAVAPTGPSAASEKVMSLNEMQASAVGPSSPVPIEFEGKLYEQIENGERLGLGQRTGLMAIIDVETDRRVGVVKIYDYPRDPEDELDVGDVFFLSMKLDGQRRAIVIESARGDRFTYHIDSGEVRQAP
jgi:hypothetical protein